MKKTDDKYAKKVAKYEAKLQKAKDEGDEKKIAKYTKTLEKTAKKHEASVAKIEKKYSQIAEFTAKEKGTDKPEVEAEKADKADKKGKAGKGKGRGKAKKPDDKETEPVEKD